MVNHHPNPPFGGNFSMYYINGARNNTTVDGRNLAPVER